MYSLLFSIKGSPIIYYGDEIGLDNNIEYFYEASLETGYYDTRFLNRGALKWNLIEEELKNSNSNSSKIFNGLKKLINVRKKINKLISQNHLVLQQKNKKVYMIEKSFENKKIIIINNLSDNEEELVYEIYGKDLITNEFIETSKIKLKPFEYKWILIKSNI